MHINIALFIRFHDPLLVFFTTTTTTTNNIPRSNFRYSGGEARRRKPFVWLWNLCAFIFFPPVGAFDERLCVCSVAKSKHERNLLTSTTSFNRIDTLISSLLLCLLYIRHLLHFPYIRYLPSLTSIIFSLRHLLYSLWDEPCGGPACRNIFLSFYFSPAILHCRWWSAHYVLEYEWT